MNEILRNQEDFNSVESTGGEKYFSKCQVDTPEEIIKLVWKLTHKNQSFFQKVVDFGAGDGRFSSHGEFGSYLGIEYDSNRMPRRPLRTNSASVEQACAFDYEENDNDLCIGNPPFVRHHDVDKNWYDRVCRKLSTKLGFQLDLRSNAFVLFIIQAIISTHDKGLISLVIPYEWVSRPSSQGLRDYITKKGWSVDVYRFKDEIFHRVLTTASITIINKSKTKTKWSYYTIDKNLKISKVKKASGTENDVIAYTQRKKDAKVFAQRGLSPGGQKVFCLTEGERIHYNLRKNRDVIPCITTLKHLPDTLNELDEDSFKEFYRDLGVRCWIIIPTATPSLQLKDYLDTVPSDQIDNYTCRRQNPWWCYRPHRAPEIIYGSGFVEFGPKILLNTIGAIAVGSVHGIHAQNLDTTAIMQKIKKIDFESQIVSHSGKLKKVEVGQMNTILTNLETI